MSHGLALAIALQTIVHGVEQPGPMHRHLFTIHRHPDWHGHPRPDRWHGHVWWTHTHA